MSSLSGTLCIAEGDNAAGEEQMEEPAAAASGSKRGADGERRDDDKVNMKAFGVSIVMSTSSHVIETLFSSRFDDWVAPGISLSVFQSFSLLVLGFGSVFFSTFAR